MDYGGTNLRLDVIAHNWNSCLLEFGCPLGIGGYENRHAIYKANSSVQCRLGIKPGGLLRAHGHIINQHICLGGYELFSHIAWLLVGYDESLLSRITPHMGGDPVQDRSHLYRYVLARNIRIKHLGAIWRGKYGLGYVLSHLSLVYVEGRHHIDITGSVTADIIMHKPYAILFIRFFVIFYPLN